MAEWADTTWGEIAELRYGKALSRERTGGGSTEVFGTNGPIGWTDQPPLFSGPRPVVGRKGAYRGVHLARGDAWVIDTAFWLEPRSGVDPLWAYHALRIADINGLGSGSAIPSTTRGDFYAMSVRLPPAHEQRAIADVLSALDDKIAANAGMSTVLESLALALVSDVPRDTPLRGVATTARSTVTPALVTDDVVNLYSLPGFDSGQIPETVAPKSIKSGKFAIEAPAVLVSKLNPRIPRVWEVPVVGATSALASTEFVVLHPVRTTTAVLWALLAQPAFSEALEAKVAGTSGSHQRVKPEEVLSMLIADPASLSDNLQDEIGALRARAHAARSETVALADLRDSLLPALMSGALRVEDAERLAEDLT